MQHSFTTSRLSVFSKLCFLAVATCFLACSTNPKYQTLPDGSKWRLLAFGDQKTKLDSAELAFLDGIILSKTGDTIRQFFNEPLQKSDDALWDVLKEQYSGDSIEYVSATANALLAEIPALDTLTYLFRIDRIRTFRQVRDERFKELAQLDNIIRSDSVSTGYIEYKGVYLRSLHAPDTAAVREGRELLLQYRGATLSGKVFDDSMRAEGPLRFVMGNENQVIDGIEIALEKMHLKEKMRVIIPSWLAFGARGSAGGLVPPYTTVVYELEVLQLGD